MRTGILIICLLLNLAAKAQAIIPLYDGPAPGTEDWDWEEGVSTGNPVGQKFVYNVTQPTLTAYLPPAHLATGTGVVIAPGGAFHFLSVVNEGSDVAEWLNGFGVAAFVLKYRLVKSDTDDPFTEVSTKPDAVAAMRSVFPLVAADGQAAVAYLREHADKYSLKTNQIGMMGFSAGADVTMRTTFFGEGNSRPDFIAPIYPPMIDLATAPVPVDTVPLFVAVAADDQLGLLPSSLSLFQKWEAAGQPAELHVYERGGHGFGMLEQNLPSDHWPEQFRAWLKLHGYLKKLDLNKYERLYGQDAVARGKLEKVKQMQTDYALLSRYRTANADLPAAKPGEQRVVFLGNSITEGWVRSDSQTSPQLLLRFRQDVLDLQPKAVVIHIGTNDVAENTGPYDPEYTMSNVRSMVELARGKGIKVVLAAVLPATKFEWNRGLGDRSQMIIDLNRRLVEYAESTGVPFVDYHGALTNSAGGMDQQFAADGVHPTAAGYAVMKKLLLPVIDRLRNE